MSFVPDLPPDGPDQYAPRWARDSESSRLRPAAAATDSSPAADGGSSPPRGRLFAPTDIRPMPVPPPPFETRRRSFFSFRQFATLALFAMMMAFVMLFLYPRKPTSQTKMVADASTATFGAAEAAQAPPAALQSTLAKGAASPVAVEPVAIAPSAAAAPSAWPAPSAAAPPAATALAAAPAAVTPLPAEPKVRGVTETEIVFGMAAPFSGPAKELGREMKLGIDTAFGAINATGGINGRQLKLVSTDDGYEPSRTADAMKQLFDKDQVFGIVGNVGTPTAMVALPYALERRMLFYGAFTGADLLRHDPPDRYVFNYRASYAEETDAAVRYLVKVRRVRPDQIAVFAQQDGYGDAGFAGVTKAVRALGGDPGAVLRLNYKRNTTDVDDAVQRLRQHKGAIKAVVMVPTYRAAAHFIEKTRDLYPNLIYTNVSFVGSTALAEELTLLGPKYADGVIVTQVVPAIEGYSSLVLDYKSALAKNFPGETPDYVSLEGYVATKLLVEGIKRAGPQLDTEKLVEAFESVRDFDFGLGTPLSFGRTEHQASHKIWATQLDQSGHYHPIDLQ